MQQGVGECNTSPRTNHAFHSNHRRLKYANTYLDIEQTETEVKLLKYNLHQEMNVESRVSRLRTGQNGLDGCHLYSLLRRRILWRREREKLEVCISSRSILQHSNFDSTVCWERFPPWSTSGQQDPDDESSARDLLRARAGLLRASPAKQRSPAGTSSQRSASQEAWPVGAASPWQGHANFPRFETQLPLCTACEVLHHGQLSSVGSLQAFF